MEMRGYPVRVYQEDDGSWAGEVPDLPGCVAGGDDPSELFEMLADAIDEWVHSAKAEGAAIPQPSQRGRYSGRFVVRTPPSLHEQLSWRADQEAVSLNSLVLVALTTYLARSEERTAVVQEFRMPVKFDWDFESSAMVSGPRHYGFRGDRTVEPVPSRLGSGNQVDLQRSLEPTAIQ